LPLHPHLTEEETHAVIARRARFRKEQKPVSFGAVPSHASPYEPVNL
jgi:hypothetical protein